jgi:hypothetical protein
VGGEPSGSDEKPLNNHVVKKFKYNFFIFTTDTIVKKKII